MAFIAHDVTPAWGEYVIFPWWIIEETTGSEESSTSLFESNAAESRVARWQEDRNRISLSGATMTQAGNRILRDFRRAVRGMFNLFLFRDIREYRAGGFDAVGAINKWEWLGDGDGVQTDFQLRLYSSFQGVEIIKNIYFPDHGYPNLVDDTNAVRSQTRYVRVWVDGTEVFNWTVDRINSGIIRFDAAPADGARVEWFGQFYNIMRCNQDSIPTKPNGVNFKVDGSVEFIEPKGRK